MRILSFILLAACASPPAPSSPAEPPRVRNVILIIGDGMGPQQLGLLDLYARRAPSSIYSASRPAMMRLAERGTVGMSATDPADGLIVDSACSATQLALGLPALSEVIGVDTRGDPQPTILERAEAEGRWTGLVSDTRLTHATPAAFAAHQPHRSLEDDIASQMITSGAEVLLSGGLRHFLPQGDASARARHGAPTAGSGSRRDEIDVLRRATQEGYQLAFDRDGLDRAVTDGGPVLGLFSDSGMMDGIRATAQADDPTRTEPSLRELTQAALDLLEPAPEGFFLMVEGGQVDWAGHANDAGWLLHELIKLDGAVDAILTWAQDRDDTLVVLTADHETGGFGLSYNMSSLPEARDLPGSAFSDQPYAPNYDFGAPERLDRLYAQQRTLYQILSEPDAREPAGLAALTERYTAFPIDEATAQGVLRTMPNPYHGEGRAERLPETMPEIHEFTAFYPGGEGARTARLARAVADQQGVVWSTGTHTHTPVNVISYGPGPLTRELAGWQHHAQLGATLQRALLGR